MKYQTIIMTMLAICTALMVTSCGKVVPPGKKVIILTPNGQTNIHEQGVYKAWGRDRAYFVDGKLNSFTEDMKILCEDDINMDVDIKSVLSFKVDADSMAFIKEKVPTQVVKDGEGNSEGFELSLEKFYSMAVKDIVRSSARNIVSKYVTDDIRPNREKIEGEISETIQTRIKALKYPIVISAILVSNIDYPESVKKMREAIKSVQLEEQKKDAQAKADLAEARRMVEVETEKAKVKIVKAEAEAAENIILAEALTPNFLMWRQFEVMENMASELGDGTVFIVPYQSVNQELLNTAMVKEAVTPVKATDPPVPTEK
jgi:regulator of protease activity HflC (stomatin/prohibitin superfamily)